MDCGKGSLTGSIIPDTDSVIFTFFNYQMRNR